MRFSGSDKYLASGADDKIVCVYTLDPNPPNHTTFGSGEAPPVENWRIFRRLIGHENDVQDLGWSPDSSVLISVGLDSRVVVWSGYTFEKLKTLSNHSSHVKGITFDPAGKYFATASDDRTVRVFRYTPPLPNSTAYEQTNNFMIETTISSPFITSPLTTYFRRCSWSPDGNHIAAANSVNGPVSTAAIINRGLWDSDISLVGHEGPIEVCAFSPRIFSKTPLDPKDDPSKAAGVTVIACAGQDRALSTWDTSTSKPLVVSEGLCVKSISDLAWSPDGENLFFTSLDGTIGLARFAKGELGYPVSMEVNATSLAKYGAGRKVGVVEGPDALVLEEKSKSDELKNVQGRMGELMGDSSQTSVPTLVSLNGPSKAATTNAKTNGIQKNPDNEAEVNTNGVEEAMDKNAEKTVETANDLANKAKIERLKSRVTIMKDGRKRVAPLLVSSSAGVTESSLPSAQLMASTSQMAKTEAPQTILDLSKPFEGLPKGGIASLLIPNKRRYAETGSEDDNAISRRVESIARQGATAITLNTVNGLMTANPALAEAASEARPSLFNPSVMLSQTRLAVPVIREHIVRPLSGSKPPETSERDRGGASNEDAHVFEVRNSFTPSRTGRPGDREPARITVTKRGQLLWQDFLPRAVMLVTGNQRFWAASCEDGSLHTWTPAGRRLFNAFAMEAQPVILDCRGPWLLAISSIGMCHIWNITDSSAPHPPVSLAPILDMASMTQGPHLTAGPAIIFARLSSEGRVYVAMSNGDAYGYSHTMHVWQRYSEMWWAVGSQYWNTSDPRNRNTQKTSGNQQDAELDNVVRLENISAGIIPLLERNTTSQTLLRGKAYFLQRLVKTLLSAEGYEGFESGVSVAHLENRLAAALSLGAKEEFKTYLGMYAKRLGAESARLKIEELLRSLLAGVYDERESSSLTDGSSVYMGGPSDELCGWKKDMLLREVILILGESRDEHCRCLMTN